MLVIAAVQGMSGGHSGQAWGRRAGTRPFSVGTPRGLGWDRPCMEGTAGRAAGTSVQKELRRLLGVRGSVPAEGRTMVEEEMRA